MTELAPTIQATNVDVFYGTKQALFGVSVSVAAKSVTAFIGPSGCGKSTFLRCINRMNDLIPGCKVTGSITLEGRDIYAPDFDAVLLRARVGMVFQKPNPFPKSIYENVAYGPRIHGLAKTKAALDAVVEESLRGAALWDEVKDRLDTLGTKLSGGQQQRLTIARALSHSPEILCLDEFSIAIDPVTTMRIEDVLKVLKKEMTIILVTNLVQQARRLAARTMFLWNGEIIELGPTEQLFGDKPKDKRTYDYVNGIFG
jgi:phosphate transport system ATP-binding protein